MKQIIKLHLAFIKLVFIDFLIFFFPTFLFICFLCYNPQQIDVLKGCTKIVYFILSCAFCIGIKLVYEWEQKNIFPKLRRLMSIKHTIQFEKYKLPFYLRLILMIPIYYCVIYIVCYFIFITQSLIRDVTPIGVVLITTIMTTLCCTITYYIGNWILPFIEYLVASYTKKKGTIL